MDLDSIVLKPLNTITVPSVLASTSAKNKNNFWHPNGIMKMQRGHRILKQYFEVKIQPQ